MTRVYTFEVLNSSLETIKHIRTVWCVVARGEGQVPAARGSG
jgi:hypothetical protein